MAGHGSLRGTRRGTQILGCPGTSRDRVGRAMSCKLLILMDLFVSCDPTKSRIN
jgi:hypothetical protein